VKNNLLGFLNLDKLEFWQLNFSQTPAFKRELY